MTDKGLDTFLQQPIVIVGLLTKTCRLTRSLETEVKANRVVLSWAGIPWSYIIRIVKVKKELFQLSDFYLNYYNASDTVHEQ